MSFVLIGTLPSPEVSQQVSVVKEGESVTIVCTVSGGKAQSIIWFKDKEAVPEKHVYSSTSRSILRLNNVSKSDGGDYECRATDFGVGYRLKTATVIVQGTFCPERSYKISVDRFPVSPTPLIFHL